MESEQVLDRINEQVIIFFKKILSDKAWEITQLIFEYNQTASMRFTFYIDSNAVYIRIFDLDIDLENSIKSYFKSQFIQNNQLLGYNEGVDKWNKAIFEYSKDGTLKSEYVWDNAQKIEEEKSTAYHFCHWLQRRLTTMMYEESGFDKRKWDRATGEFWVNDQEVKFVGKAFNKRNQESLININLESWDVRKALIEHFEITNNGILKDFWQPWNKLTIRVFQDDYFRESEHTDYSLDKGDGIAEKIEGLPVKYN
jgi:hypothetical protein